MDESTKPPTVPPHAKKPRFRRSDSGPRGLAQLSLVEHALCPLDAATALRAPGVFETAYPYTDGNRHRRRAKVRVMCPAGLSPTDEFYLWGLLALTFSQPHPAIDFYATPYYCLRQLACIDSESRHGGGKNYQLFREALTRLAAVTYYNDRFYDPVRGEHRDVAFGFLSYSLPADPASSRAWRIAWDPVSFEFCAAASGALVFDFGVYRQLDPASRRLFLLLKKVFWRSAMSPKFDLIELAVNVLGFSPTHEPYELKRKVARCAAVPAARDLISLPSAPSASSGLFTKRGKGRYTVRFARGPAFGANHSLSSLDQLTDSPHYDLLHEIGLDDRTIAYILRSFKCHVIAECADITLAAQERFGQSFFKQSPQAHFMDNLKHFAQGTRTPPDWWRELKKHEELQRRNASTRIAPDDAFEAEFEEYLNTEARDAFERVMQRIFGDFKALGQSDRDAGENAQHHARTHFRHRFRAKYSGRDTDGPVRLGDLVGT